KAALRTEALQPLGRADRLDAHLVAPLDVEPTGQGELWRGVAERDAPPLAHTHDAERVASEALGRAPPQIERPGAGETPGALDDELVVRHYRGACCVELREQRALPSVTVAHDRPGGAVDREGAPVEALAVEPVGHHGGNWGKVRMNDLRRC